MKNEMIVGIVLSVAMVIFALQQKTDYAYIAYFAMIITAVGAYWGYNYENRKSYIHALISPIALCGLAIVPQIAVFAWLVSVPYLGYKAFNAPQ